MGLSLSARRFLVPVLWLIVISVLAVGFFPLAVWTSFLASAVRVRFYLGFWPYSGHPDPSQIPHDAGPIPEWVENVVPLLALAVLVGTSLVVMTRRVPKRWWLWTAVAIWLAAWGCCWGVAVTDPWGFLDWGFD